jgi:hypothetical protein
LKTFGYEKSEVLGKNCRFLQGKDTDKNDVARIRSLIEKQEQGVVRILNYTKSGSSLENIFLLFPLRDAAGSTKLFFGAQCEADQAPVALRVAGEPVQSNLAYRVPGGPAIVPNVNAEGATFANEFAKGRILVKTRTDPVSPQVAK